MLSELIRNGINPNPRKKGDGSPSFSSAWNLSLTVAFERHWPLLSVVRLTSQLLSGGARWDIGPTNQFGTNDTPVRPIHLFRPTNFALSLTMEATHSHSGASGPMSSSTPGRRPRPVPSFVQCSQFSLLPPMTNFNAQADLHYRSQLREPPAPAIPAEDDDIPGDDPFEEQTPTQEMEEAFAPLLRSPPTKTLISWSLISPLKTISRCRSSLFRIHYIFILSLRQKVLPSNAYFMDPFVLSMARFRIATSCLHTALLPWQSFAGSMSSLSAMPVLPLSWALRLWHHFSGATPLRFRLISMMSSCCDPTWSLFLQKQRSRPSLSAPDDERILPWNHKNIHRKLPCYIDDLYNRLA